MDLCELCYKGVQQLLPQGSIQNPSTDKVEGILPLLDATTYNNCWICYKFAQWLEFHRHDLFEEWGRVALRVRYKFRGVVSKSWAFTPKQLRSFAMEVIPIGERHDEGDDATGYLAEFSKVSRKGKFSLNGGHCIS